MNIKYKVSFFLLVSTFLATTSITAHAAEASRQANAAATVGEEESPGFAGSYLSGRFAKDNGDVGSAIYYLKRVHAEKPANLDIARQLQGLLLLKGETEDATVLAADIHKIDRKDALSNLLLALKAIRQNESQKALELLETSSETGRVQLWEPLITAWLDVENKQLDKALTISQLNLDAGRIMPLVNYHLALINSEADFKHEAAENFKKAIDNPKDPPDRIMGQMLTFYEKNGKPELLRPLVEAYRESHPDKKEGVPLIVNMRDGVAEILYTMGGIMLSAGMSNDAAIYQQLALYIKPEFPEAALTLADSYSDLRQFDRANQYYEMIAPDSAYYKKAQLHVAINYERIGELDKAIAILDSLNSKYPNSIEALVTKADFLRIHSRFEEAVKVYTLALNQAGEIKNAYWPVYFARGSCYERLGRWNDAEADLQQALELKPDQPDVLNYLAYGWLERNQNMTQARDMIETAFKARPDDAEIVDSMGWALYLNGEYASAARYLEKAVELLPGDPTVNDHLGDVYWRIGRKTEARFQWERSLTFSPDEKLFKRLNQKLKEGLPDNHKTTSVSANQPRTPATSSIR
jgi:tetratricopeptide (TPR) repeat protein